MRLSGWSLYGLLELFLGSCVAVSVHPSNPTVFVKVTDMYIVNTALGEIILIKLNNNH